MKVKLGELTRIKTGKLDANASSPDGEYPLFTCSREPLRISSYTYDCECVLVAGNGDLNVKYYKGKFDAYQRTYIIEDNGSGRLYMPYLFHFMEGYVEELRKLSIGGVIKYIKLGNLTDAMIELPDMETQKSIVNILSKAKDIIDSRNQEIQMLDDLIKARFVEMFRGSNCPSVDLIDLITEGSGLSYGIVQPGDDGTGDMGVLRPVDMVNGKISFSSIKYINRAIGDGFKKTELTGDELLITVRGTTGITALTDMRFKGMNVTRGIAVIRFDRRKINPVYLNAYLNTEESQRFIQEHTRGATLQQINLADLRVQRILVPPMELQEEFSAFATQVDKSKTVAQKAMDEAQLLFDSLMQQYFG